MIKALFFSMVIITALPAQASPCHIIGDSIAVGVSQYLPQCNRVAVIGINSGRFNRLYGHLSFTGVVVISLGANDGGVDTLSNLRKIRSRIHGDVIWIIPTTRNQGTLAAIQTISQSHGDRIITYISGPDSIHPTPRGYRALSVDTGII